eukprot:TRINITY_DN8611_c0_g1_i1.p1 TRINITY_DN8611_c0_g1~~TRINITY_DN8611_c0_g1_i1.p1  ORF type:complete len:261 (+),score=30.51 TRINITY_DN8611_c0_g1_i1:1-783(+)
MNLPDLRYSNDPKFFYRPDESMIVEDKLFYSKSTQKIVMIPTKLSEGIHYAEFAFISTTYIGVGLIEEHCANDSNPTYNMYQSKSYCISSNGIYYSNGNMGKNHKASFDNKYLAKYIFPEDLKRTVEFISKNKQIGRIGVLVNFYKNEIYFYHGNKTKGMRLDTNKMTFNNPHLYYDICLGMGVCYICEDVDLPDQLPKGYNIYLKWSTQNFHLYHYPLRKTIHKMMLVRNRLNNTTFSKNKIPKVICFLCFEYLVISYY